MIRVILDTNIIISAYLNQDGLPFSILKLVLADVVHLYVSEPILAEYEELLHRKSYPLDKRRARLLLTRIHAASTVVKTAGGLSETSDPDDNIFLECAQTAKAHYLITGNTDHFPKNWKYTKIVTPRMFITVWKDLPPGVSEQLRQGH